MHLFAEAAKSRSPYHVQLRLGVDVHCLHLGPGLHGEKFRAVLILDEPCVKRKGTRSQV